MVRNGFCKVKLAFVWPGIVPGYGALMVLITVLPSLMAAVTLTLSAGDEPLLRSCTVQYCVLSSHSNELGLEIFVIDTSLEGLITRKR